MGGAVADPAEAAETVLEASESGDRRRLLVALRRSISADITAGVPSRDLASLSLRLLAIAKELEEIDAWSKGDAVADAAAAPAEPFNPS